MHITPILHFLKRSQESGGKLHPFLHPFGLLIVICPLSNTTRIPLNCADFDVGYAELDISNSGSNPVTSTKKTAGNLRISGFFLCNLHKDVSLVPFPCNYFATFPNVPKSRKHQYVVVLQFYPLHIAFFSK